VENLIVSLSYFITEAYCQREIEAPVELGLKLDISACDRFPCMEKQSFEAYNVSMALKAFIKRYRWRIRECPERVIETRFIGIVII